MAGYYDYVLGLIPVALFGITAALMLGGISLTSAVPVGAGVSMAVMGHAMFVRSPTSDAGVRDVQEVQDVGATEGTGFAGGAD